MFQHIDALYQQNNTSSISRDVGAGSQGQGQGQGQGKGQGKGQAKGQANCCELQLECDVGDGTRLTQHGDTILHQHRPRSANSLLAVAELHGEAHTQLARAGGGPRARHVLDENPSLYDATGRDNNQAHSHCHGEAGMRRQRHGVVVWVGAGVCRCDGLARGK